MRRGGGGVVEEEEVDERETKRKWTCAVWFP
jgi:hypothetical protein